MTEPHAREPRAAATSSGADAWVWRNRRALTRLGILGLLVSVVLIFLVRLETAASELVWAAYVLMGLSWSMVLAARRSRYGRKQ